VGSNVGGIPRLDVALKHRPVLPVDTQALQEELVLFIGPPSLLEFLLIEVCWAQPSHL
jgi:hypothetical protein